MLEPKILLAKCLTLIYRENLLASSSDNSVELIKKVLKDIKVVEHAIGLNEDKQIINGLKQTIVELCETVNFPFEKRDILQRTKLNCEGDDRLYDALSMALETDYNDSELKNSVVSLRRQIDNHFREKEIAEMFRKASADLNYNRDQIADISNYVNDFMTKLEPLNQVTKDKDPAIMSSIDTGNNEELKKIFQAVKSDGENARVYKLGFKGMNEMTNGGLRGSETDMHLALPHKYKTGLNLTLFSQVLRYNTPKTKNKNKIPCHIRISFEDELSDNVKFLFTQMRYTETREVVNLGDYTDEYMSEFITEAFHKNGWRVFMLRVDPTAWTYKDVFNFVTTKEAEGYSVEGLWLDYMGLLPTTGCIQGNAGEAVRDMLRRFKNFASAKGILFVTPHQLSTTAKALLRGTTTDAMFVKDIAERGLAAGCGQLDTETDLEFYHHKFVHGNESYLAIQRGKHRGQTIRDEKKFFILKFPSNLMPIPDDIYDDGPVIRKIGSSSSVSAGDEDLLIIT